MSAGWRSWRAGGWLGLLLAASLAGFLGGGCASRQERAQTHLERATRYEAQGDGRAALMELKTAHKLAPQDADVTFRLGKLLWDMHQGRDALFYFRETVRLDPKHEEAALDEAALLFQSDPKQAEKLIRGVLDRDPKSVLAHIRLSQLALFQRNAEKALEEALTATNLDAHSVEAHLQEGLVQEARIRQSRAEGKTPKDALFQAAIHAFDQALEISPAKGETASRARAALERARVFATWPGHDADTFAAFRKALDTAEKKPKLVERVVHTALNAAGSPARRDLRMWALEQQVELYPQDYATWRKIALAKDPRTKSRSSVMEKLIAERPDDARAQAAYAADLVARGEVEQAIAHMKKVSGQVKPEAVALWALVSLHLQHGDLEAAKALRDRIHREFPNSPQDFHAAAAVAVQEGKLGDAADALQKLIGVRETGDAQLELARVQLKRRDFASALQAINRAAELTPRRSPTYPTILTVRGAIQEANGDPNGAIRTFKVLQRRLRGRLLEGALLPLARALYATDRAPAAREVLKPMLSGPHARPKAILLYSREEEKRDPAGVRALLDRALGQWPKSGRLIASRAALDMRAGDVGAAEKRLRAGIQAVPDSAPLRVLLVRVLAREGRTEEALAAAQQLMKVMPGAPEGPQVLADLLVRTGHVSQARKELEARQAKGSLDAGGKMLLARLDIASGDADQATGLLEAVLRERPNLPEAQNDLAFLLAKQGKDLDRALNLAQNARSALPDESPVADTLGFVYLKRGLPEAAVSQLQSALQLASPGSPEWSLAQFHMGLALASMNQPQKAREAYQKALAHDFPEAAEARAALQKLQASKG